MRRPQLHRRFLPVVADNAGGPDRLDAIVLCPGLIQNRFSFEAPTRSLPAFLMRRGFCIYVLEPHGRHRHASGPRADRLQDVLSEDVVPQVSELLVRHRQVSWVGHSLGGLIGLLLPENVSNRLTSMVTVGTPLLPAMGAFGFRGVDRLVAATSRRLHRRHVPLPGKWVGRAFRVFQPAMNFPGARYPLQIYAPGSMHPADLGFFLKNSWAQDSFGVVCDLIELLLHEGDAPDGLPLGERLRALVPPLLVIGGDLDGLAPPKAVKALFERAGSPEKSLRMFGRREHGVRFGHMDLLIGKAAPRTVWPAIADFLQKHHAVTRPVAAMKAPGTSRQ